jgi:hypothetical protein
MYLTNKEGYTKPHVLYCDKTRQAFENTREMLKSRAEKHGLAFFIC